MVVLCLEQVLYLSVTIMYILLMVQKMQKFLSISSIDVVITLPIDSHISSFEVQCTGLPYLFLEFKGGNFSIDKRKSCRARHEMPYFPYTI